MPTRRQFNKQLGGAVIGSLVGTNIALSAENAKSPLQKASAVSSSTGIGDKGWTIAVIPDTQNYAKYLKNQPNFDLMTDWIAKHIEPWNIQAVLHEGDFVEQNDIATGGGRGFGDQNAESQWKSAQKSMATLYGKVPTILTTGNHDYGFRNAENRRTQFNNYFGLTDNSLVCDGRGKGIWREGFTNSFGATTLEQARSPVQAPGGRSILIIALEWGPRDEVVQWAKQALKKPEYKDHLGILLTHNFMNDNDKRDGSLGKPGSPHSYPTGKNGNTNDGQELWDKLVKDSGLIKLVLNGHVMGKHVGYRADNNSTGSAVHQMLFNAQGLGGGSKEKGNGGDGWIRLLTFEPDKKTLSVRTFSPLREKQGKSAWNTAAGHDFVINL